MSAFGIPMRVQVLRFLRPGQVMTCAQLRKAVSHSLYGHNPTHSSLSGILNKMVEQGELARVLNHGPRGGHGYRLPVPSDDGMEERQFWCYGCNDIVLVSRTPEGWRKDRMPRCAACGSTLSYYG